MVDFYQHSYGQNVIPATAPNVALYLAFNLDNVQAVNQFAFFKQLDTFIHNISENEEYAQRIHVGATDLSLIDEISVFPVEEFRFPPFSCSNAGFTLNDFAYYVDKVRHSVVTLRNNGLYTPSPIILLINAGNMIDEAVFDSFKDICIDQIMLFDSDKHGMAAAADTYYQRLFESVEYFLYELLDKGCHA